MSEWYHKVSGSFNRWDRARQRSYQMIISRFPIWEQVCVRDSTFQRITVRSRSRFSGVRISTLNCTLPFIRRAHKAVENRDAISIPNVEYRSISYIDRRALISRYSMTSSHTSKGSIHKGCCDRRRLINAWDYKIDFFLFLRINLRKGAKVIPWEDLQTSPH